MPLILGRERVLAVYAEAAQRKWVLPAFNSENRTSTEAILAAAKEHADCAGCKDLPIIVGITNTYWHRPQAVNYTHTRDWKIGMRMFLGDLATLTGPDSPYRKLRVLVHLDHIQWDSDAEFLGWDLGQFSSIMYDASTLPIDENIRKTAAFVARHGKQIVVEGACDEVGEAAESTGVTLTPPEMAARYPRETGVDLIVANLGTEHRASTATLRYHGDLAREITRRIGPRLCLHGTSSVPPDQVAHLFADGVRKVNLWTTLERDSTPVLFQDMLANAARLVGKETARRWVNEGWLGEKADKDSVASVSHYTTTYRQQIIFEEMKRIVMRFLKLWYT